MAAQSETHHGAVWSKATAPTGASADGTSLSAVVKPAPPAVAPAPVPSLSIVIPAYNEERRLPATLEAVAQWAAGHNGDIEIVVVENGSTDDTASLAQDFASRHPSATAHTGLPRGKGVAVRHGMLAARGDLRFLCDADLSMPIDNLAKFMTPVREGGVDVAIGSREASGARRFGEPPHRHLMGRVFNLVVQAIAVPGIEDTQCGFKMFTATAAEDIFRRVTLHGWGFDPEVLFLARKLGYRVAEVPIDWHYRSDSRVRAVADSLAMLRDLVVIRLNSVRGIYDA